MQSRHSDAIAWSLNMRTLKSRIAIAAAILASVASIAANAADGQQAVSTTIDAPRVAQSSQRDAKPESAQFERFENQMQILSAPSYTPSEHRQAKQAPRPPRFTRSVFDDPMNTRSPG
jgi:hypothetical protein